ncbi:hypothetical protein AZE42_03389 [Rhizopogon vesiculosus]|uniref:GPI anchored protein n=1 Tax=Rhizopogon vesiculosus TaxID=180088 RepID=A0A1J8QKV9_9AGAM|nr:hypothetical protein AZE42_03389 [Rhizopogon vesiculosus]
MIKSFISLTLFVAGALAQLTINTPANVVECQPTLLSWSGGTAPYFLVGNFLTRFILPGGSPTSASLENLGQQNSTSVTWICNIASGTSLGLTLVDSTGLTAQTAPFTVNPGSSTSCTNSTSLSAGPTGQTTAQATSVGSGATSTHPATIAATTSGTKTSTTTSASASASSGAAYANVVRVGAAGVAGAAVAALLF